jgi:endo-1,4-beta-xylanase
LPLTALQTTAAGWGEPSLKDAFADYFYFGNVVEPWEITNEEWNEHFIYHYNFVTLENRMKPNIIAPTKGNYVFTQADQIVEWAQENSINVVGHTLVWHSQSPLWLTNSAPGQVLTRAEARQNMQDYINAVAGHFKGKIHTWDVVNEAFTTGVGNVSGNWRNGLRKTQSDVSNGTMWYAAYASGADASKGECGSDYIYDAYVFTRLADPDAVLYYNDFNEHNPTKRTAIALMVEDLNERWETDPRNTEPDRLLIEGIGMQAHYWTNEANSLVNNVRASIQRFAATGAKVSITELDLPIGGWNNYGEHNAANFMLQARLYKELFEVFVAHSDVIERVTIWGVRDMRSWRRPGAPLLFFDDLRPKPAFHGVMQPKSIEVIGNATISPVNQGFIAGAKVKTAEGEDTITKESQFVLIVSEKIKPSDSDVKSFFNALKKYLD